MNQEKIDRINQLAKLAKERDLTPQETQERATLRQEYIASVKASLSSQLDNTYFLESDGRHQKLEKKKEES